MISKLLPLFCFLLFFSTSVSGQSAIVTDISLKGNEKTKDFVILRELVVHEDSAYYICSQGNLFPLIERSKNRILNLNLFNKVDIITSEDSSSDGYTYYSLDIVVIEKWYAWPIPFVEFSDRNFNVWGNLNFDVERTNAGLYLFNYNLFGRNHTLKSKIKTGYNTELGVEYRIPFISRKSQWGLKTIADYSSQDEIWYQTRNDSLQFYKNGEKDIRKRSLFSLELSKRITPYMRVFWEAQYEKNTINIDRDPISSRFQNIDYNHVFSGSLSTEIDSRDNIYYPTSGSFISPKLTYFHLQDNQSVSNIKLEARVQFFPKLGEKWSSAIALYGQTNTLRNLAYAKKRQLGYDDIVRGFEHYVVDGYQTLKGNVAFRYHLIHQSDLTLDFIPIKNYKVLPFNVYLETFVDAGRVYDETPHSSNTLVNSNLYSAGIGLNSLFYNDRLLRLEYSLNSLKEGGFFVHFKKAI
ncbi:MAG: BamA/TamA family outer membrane protein [Bacteroidia bacterium]